MKAFLMYRDRDLDLKARLPAHAPALAQDLDLETLFEAMSLGDEFLSDVARAALLTSLTDAETIRYRQGILKDCLENADLIRSEDSGEAAHRFRSYLARGAGACWL
jgi:hypothetical protein